MAIDAVTSTSSSVNQNARLGMEDFLKVLLTQLTYQDPLKPMDNQQFMAQMAQFTSLEQTQQLNTKLEQLINNQASLQSIGLLGRTVDVSSGSSTLTGTVSSLSFKDKSPVLTLTASGGTVYPDIPLSQLLAVR